MKAKKILILSIFFFLCVFMAKSQESEMLRTENQKYRDALDLFDKKVYASAQQLFGTLINMQPSDKRDPSLVFYYAACSYYLHNNDALQLLTDFVEEYQTANDVNMAYFLIGNEYFNNRKYKKTIENYEKTNTLRLSHQEISQYFFNCGYSHLMLENEDEAQKCFSKIKSGKGEYAEKAKFYDAVINYQKQRYEMARTAFLSLKNNAQYSKQISLYLIDIEHRQLNWDGVIQIGTELLTDNRLEKKEKNAVAAMLVDAYFNKGDTEEARKYIELYEQKLRGKQNRVMQYQYGFLQYEKGAYQDAIDRLMGVMTENDSITQSAYNLQGYSYLLLNKKREAQKAFYNAYKMDFLKKITEDAMFNYVKLACELSYDPYRDAFTVLKNFIEQNPESDRVEEAHRYIVNLSLSTKNYADAILALEKIKNKTPEMLAVEQRIQYLYAIHLFNAKKYQNAIDYFQKAIHSNIDTETSSKSTYWMAEAYYRMGLAFQAEESFNKFKNLSAAKKLSFYGLANYHLGYIKYGAKKFSEAAQLFKKFTTSSNQSVTIMRDAYLRTGDCYYALKEYEQALIEYDKAIQSSVAEGDYASFQKALCLGALKRYNEEIQQLNKISEDYPKSPLMREVLYETAMTYLVINNSARALTFFNRVINEFPYTQFAVKSNLRKGLILYGQDRNEEALSVLKKVVDNHPNTPESKEALKVIENIYLSMNRVNEYISYTATVPFADISNAQKDSLAYFSAENLYTHSKYTEAIFAFDGYIQQFPNGIFLEKARLYLADCAMNTHQREKALEQYEVLAQTPIETNKLAVAQAAALRFERGDFKQALNHYKKSRMLATQTSDMIDPTIGMMRCYEHLGFSDSLSMISFELLSYPKVPKEVSVEAHNNIAVVAFQSNNYELAKKEFQVVRSLGSGVEAAKANYYLAEILFKEQKYDESMEVSFNLINDFPNEDDWVVKSFILLSDIYVAKGNSFQAEQTLKSIIDNCENEEMKNIAIQKMKSIQLNYPKEGEDD